MSLSPAFLDELRARTSLSALIGRTLKLQRAGREFKACCPFHNEKTPSFTINDDKGFYHCFGCSAHGDAIRWLTESQGLPFMDAVKELAAAAGMDVPAPDPRAQARDERAAGLYEAMAAAEAFFVRSLAGIEGAEARAYLAQRAITPETAAAFGLGFAPDARGKLRAALKSFGDPLLVEAGLLIEVEDKQPYDRFRGRLMIPIRDSRGRTIAFGGRILGKGEPKYLNSPETPLFDKGRTLYNLDRAAAASRSAGRLIVVEGYLDVIALAQAGIGEVVAPLGTALTEAQIERLWRLDPAPMLCFDGDNAGQKAAVRAIERALPGLAPGRTLAFATLPQGQDPDDLVRAGGRPAMEAVLERAEPLAERLWRHECEAEPLHTPEARAGLKQRLAARARAIGDADVRDQYFRHFREHYDRVFAAQAAHRPSRGAPRGRGPIEPAPSPAARAISSVGVEPLFGRAILAGFLRYPETLPPCLEALSAVTIANPELDTLRRLLVARGFRSPPLESAELRAILADAGLEALAADLLKPNRLRFSFAQEQAPVETVLRDLQRVLEALAIWVELDSEIALLGEKWGRDGDARDFDEQLRLTAARNHARNRLAALTVGDD